MPAVRFVLVEPTHPGNIGGAARAMKTMGFDQLCLVNPRRFPADEAEAMAVGADDVLKRASLAGSLAEAIADCSLVIGTSARPRRIRWPSLSPAAAATELARFMQSGQAAVVFGRESSGLENKELDFCHYLVRIPCNPTFRSLNLSSAVQVIAYEIRKHMLASDRYADKRDKVGVGGIDGDASSGRDKRVTEYDPDAPAALEEVERFYIHLESALHRTRFFADRQSKSLMRRLRKLFNRTHLSQREVNILHGMVSAFEREQQPDESGSD